MKNAESEQELVPVPEVVPVPEPLDESEEEHFTLKKESDYSKNSRLRVQ